MTPPVVNTIATALIIMSTRWRPTITNHRFPPVIVEYLDSTQWKKEKGLEGLLLTEPFISKAARDTLEEEGGGEKHTEERAGWVLLHTEIEKHTLKINVK